MSLLLIGLTTFLASAVEAVEALTIVLAVGVTSGWNTALRGAAAAVGALAAAVIVGALIGAVLPIALVRIVVGAFLIVFGLQWLSKAIMRYAGRKALRNEATAYAHQVETLRQEPEGKAGSRLGYVTAFNGVFLEGLEVVLIVITVGSSTSGSLVPAILGAVLAFVVVSAAGYLVRRPLERVPENTMKFVVGVMLVSFGIFWLGQGLGVAWWHDDLSIVLIALICAALCWIAVLSVRWRSSQTPPAQRPSS